MTGMLRVNADKLDNLSGSVNSEKLKKKPGKLMFINNWKT